MSNIAILGCGYVGKQLAVDLTLEGHLVTGSTTSEDKVAHLSNLMHRVLVVEGSDSLSLGKLLEGQDVLIISLAPDKYDDYQRTYLETIKSLNQIIDLYPNIQKIIYLSSCAVYGHRDGKIVDEITPIDKSTFTSESQKVLAKTEAILLSSGLDVCIFRLGGIYGVGRTLQSIFTGYAGEFLVGKGDHFVNWINVRDVIRAIKFAIKNDLTGIYNLAVDSNLTFRQQVELVFNKYNIFPKVVWGNNYGYNLPLKSLRVSNQKIKNTGFKFLQSCFTP